MVGRLRNLPTLNKGWPKEVNPKRGPKCQTRKEVKTGPNSIWLKKEVFPFSFFSPYFL